jgi:hypothetical protein
MIGSNLGVGSREVRPKFRRGMPGTAGDKSCAKKKSAKCPAGEIGLGCAGTFHAEQLIMHDEVQLRLNGGLCLKGGFFLHFCGGAG